MQYNGYVQILTLISLIIIIIGIGCAVFALKLHRRSLYLFFAALFLQTGLFLFLHSIDVISLGFPRAWPLLSIFTGAALIPAGWHRYGVFKTNYIVLSAAFVILGAVMMFFALGLVAFSLKQFVRDWWLLLILLGACILALTFLGAHFSKKHDKIR